MGSPSTVKAELKPVGSGIIRHSSRLKVKPRQNVHLLFSAAALEPSKVDKPSRPVATARTLEAQDAPLAAASEGRRGRRAPAVRKLKQVMLYHCRVRSCEYFTSNEKYARSHEQRQHPRRGRCKVCNVYIHNKGLMAEHIKSVHDLEPTAIKCDLCEHVARDRCALENHCTYEHYEGARRNERCQETVVGQPCVARFLLIRQLREHLAEVHGIAAAQDTMHEDFTSVQEFREWKARFEWDTRAVYQIGYGRRHNSQRFLCSRSGSYRPVVATDGRQRRLKRFGTIKLGFKCTSEMNVRFGEGGRVSVVVHTFHYGHVPGDIPLPRMRKHHDPDDWTAIESRRDNFRLPKAVMCDQLSTPAGETDQDMLHIELQVQPQSPSELPPPTTTQMQTELELQPRPHPLPQPHAEDELHSQTQLQLQIKSELHLQPKTEPNIQTNTELQCLTQSQPQSQSESQPLHLPHFLLQTESEFQPETLPEQQPQLESHSQSQPELQPQALPHFLLQPFAELLPKPQPPTAPGGRRLRRKRRVRDRRDRRDRRRSAAGGAQETLWLSGEPQAARSGSAKVRHGGYKRLLGWRAAVRRLQGELSWQRVRQHAAQLEYERTVRECGDEPADGAAWLLEPAGGEPLTVLRSEPTQPGPIDCVFPPLPLPTAPVGLAAATRQLLELKLQVLEMRAGMVRRAATESRIRELALQQAAEHASTERRLMDELDRLRADLAGAGSAAARSDSRPDSRPSGRTDSDPSSWTAAKSLSVIHTYGRSSQQASDLAGTLVEVFRRSTDAADQQAEALGPDLERVDSGPGSKADLPDGSHRSQSAVASTLGVAVSSTNTARTSRLSRRIVRFMAADTSRDVPVATARKRARREEAADAEHGTDDLDDLACQAGSAGPQDKSARRTT